MRPTAMPAEPPVSVAPMRPSRPGRCRLALVLVLACAVLGVAGAAAPPADAALKAIWGPNTLPDGSSAFPVYDRLGVDVLQHQLIWRRVATARPEHPRDPNDPAYRWPKALDRSVAEGDRFGIRSAIMVRDTPDWANGNRGPQWVSRRVADYADFAAAAARHYPTVRFWMIWGEPT